MNILFFDTETTGVDRMHDEIIELSMLMVRGDQSVTVTHRFKPSRPITPEAFAAHGISAEMLLAEPAFETYAKDIFGRFYRADVIGAYNLDFDRDMLMSAFKRAGITSDPFDGKLWVDPYRMWQRLEPRSLTDAVRVFTGRDFTDAHGAEADVRATWDILAPMCERHGLDPTDWDRLCETSFPDRVNWIGPSHHIQWVDGRPCVMFGKYTGKPVAHLDAGFCQWVMGKDFPAHVKRIMAIAYEYAGAQVDAEIAAAFPNRMAVAA